jgi:hypothetical protein
MNEKDFRAEVLSWPGVTDCIFNFSKEFQTQTQNLRASVTARNGVRIRIDDAIPNREIYFSTFSGARELVSARLEGMLKKLRPAVQKALRPEWMSPAVEGLIREWEGHGFDVEWPNTGILADAMEEAGFSEQEYLEGLRDSGRWDGTESSGRVWRRWQAREVVFRRALECGVVEGPTLPVVQSTRGGR